MEIKFEGAMPEIIMEIQVFLNEMGLTISVPDEQPVTQEREPVPETEREPETVVSNESNTKGLPDVTAEDTPAEKPKRTRKPKAKKAEEPKVEPAEEPAEEMHVQLEGEEAKQAAIDKLMAAYNDGKASEVKKLLEQFGVKKFGEVDPERGVELLAEAEKLAA